MAVAQANELPKRIVSLAPSMTEILFALGLGDRTVGVTSFCDYPEEAKAKPKIGGMSNPSIEAIVSMKPDIVVMTTDGNPKEVDERLRSLKIGTYVWKARTLSELPEGIRELGKTLGVSTKADEIAREIEQGIRKASGVKREATTPTDSFSTLPLTPHSSRKKVLFIVWPEPLIVAGPGTAIDEAVTLLGAENIAASAKTTYPRYSIEEVIHEAPEVLIVGKGSGMDMQEVSQGVLKKLARVPAVKNGAVCYVGDGLYRLGPRVVKGIEELSECLK
jgi:iron complex transport system substrate-binding protein